MILPKFFNRSFVSVCQSASFVNVDRKRLILLIIMYTRLNVQKMKAHHQMNIRPEYTQLRL